MHWSPISNRCPLPNRRMEPKPAPAPRRRKLRSEPNSTEVRCNSMPTATPQSPVPQAIERENYLNKEYGVWSWLLTTDHKRIALLYLISITFFFFIRGFFALLIRLELLTPAGDLVQADTYNKLFTMHGMLMVFFFLIPSIPAVLGNFLVPLMIGAKDLAF